MKYWSFLFTIFLTITANATTKKSGIDNDCVALFYKDGISAGFPLLKKRESWEWYKKEYPEYSWIAETGFYKKGKFVGNGFGFSISIGSLNLEKTPPQKGTIQDLISFSTKNGFLTKNSKYYSDENKKDQVLYYSNISAKMVDDELIMIWTINPNAVNMARSNKPTHMKLQAILPEKGESYTCFPRIDLVN